MNEAKSVNQIGHDHIVDITDFGHTPGGDFYFIMEHLDGRSLADAITQDGPFDPARALNIAAQIADALNSSHEHGIVHRDLKPENIFLIVRDEGSGLREGYSRLQARKLTQSPDEPLTHDTGPGSVMGTPFYMAPEQCEGKADLDHRTGRLRARCDHVRDADGAGSFRWPRVRRDPHQADDRAAARGAQHPARALALALGSHLVPRAGPSDPGTRFQTMAEFRAALLDPEGYGASGQVMGALDDLSLRVRAAMPMARARGAAPPRARFSLRAGGRVGGRSFHLSQRHRGARARRRRSDADKAPRARRSPRGGGGVRGRGPGREPISSSSSTLTLSSRCAVAEHAGDRDRHLQLRSERRHGG